MTKQQREAMQQAMEVMAVALVALEKRSSPYSRETHWGKDICAAITALRAALAEPEPEQEQEPEPVAISPWWASRQAQALDALNRMQSILMMADGRHPRDVLRGFIQLASKPARPLTHSQIHELDWPDDVAFEDILEFARAIERAHGITGGNDE